MDRRRAFGPPVRYSCSVREGKKSAQSEEGHEDTTICDKGSEMTTHLEPDGDVFPQSCCQEKHNDCDDVERYNGSVLEAIPFCRGV